MKKRRGSVLKDFLKVESIDELVSSEEKELFRMKRFMSRQRILHEIEQQKKQKKRPVNKGKVSYSSKKQKEIDYKPLKYKPILYIPLKRRNMFRYSYRRRFKKGKIRRRAYSGTVRRSRRMRERINHSSEKTGYLEGIVQGQPKISTQYRPEERYLKARPYQKAA